MTLIAMERKEDTCRTGATFLYELRDGKLYLLSTDYVCDSAYRTHLHIS